MAKSETDVARLSSLSDLTPERSGAMWRVAAMARAPFASMWHGFCHLGQHRSIEVSAETQTPLDDDSSLGSTDPLSDGTVVVVGTADGGPHLVGTTYVEQQKDTTGGRFFDCVVNIAGMRTTYVLILLIVIGWAIAGGIMGGPDVWQIIMQDGSSIQCYVSDTLLMRQQQNHCRDMLRMVGMLRSRMVRVGDAFESLRADGRLERAAHELGHCKAVDHDDVEGARVREQEDAEGAVGASRVALGLERVSEVRDMDDEVTELDEVGDAVHLPTRNLFDKVCVFISTVVGSFYMVIVYWIGMLCWIGLGDKYHWGDNWQLWLNTVVATFLTLTSTLLTMIRRSHSEYMDRCMNAILKYDCMLEYRARQMTGLKPSNPPIAIEWEKVDWASRAIDWYADLVASGYGVCISIGVFAAWIGIGGTMGWNSNWWLIIGTYTGLVGFLDGFVLRNGYYRENNKLEREVQVLVAQDMAIFESIGLKGRAQLDYIKPTLMSKISWFVGYVCSTPWAVLASILVILGLVAAASGMLWSETAQLMVNSPTMIIEGFLLIVLIDAHNIAAINKRVTMHDILVRRLQLLVVLRRVDASERKRAFGGASAGDLKRPFGDASAGDLKRPLGDASASDLERSFGDASASDLKRSFGDASASDLKRSLGDASASDLKRPDSGANSDPGSGHTGPEPAPGGVIQMAGLHFAEPPASAEPKE